jgi:hypothetical protein
VHAAVASLAADGDHVKAADLWRGDMTSQLHAMNPITRAVYGTSAMASIVDWDEKVARLGVVRAVDDLVDAFADAEDPS